MTRMATPALNDRSMWRRLFLRIHPDQGGDGELFVWTRELLEHIEGRTAGGCAACLGPGSEPSYKNHGSHRDGRSAPDRVDFPNLADHARITARAVEMASEVGEPYARLLESLARCGPSPVGPREERTGATYKQLAYVAHLVGMSARERASWYEIAREIPLSQRHASYLIERLRGAAA